MFIRNSLEAGFLKALFFIPFVHDLLFYTSDKIQGPAVKTSLMEGFRLQVFMFGNKLLAYVNVLLISYIPSDILENVSPEVGPA